MGARARQRGQVAVELVAAIPLLAAVAVLVAVVATSSHSWVRAESAARAGTRAAVVGAPVDEAAARVAPAGARVRVAERGLGAQRRSGIRVAVPSRAVGPPGLRLPGLEGWSPTR